MAAIPWGIDSWRKPVVLEKTRTVNRGAAVSAATVGSADAQKTSPMASKGATVVVTGGRDCRLTARCRNLTLAPAKITFREMAMKWKTPVIIEIAVGLEI